jgi:hypothetical protein
MSKNIKCSISHNYLLYTIVIVFSSINGWPIGWERILSLPNTHGTLYSNASLSNIELLKLHIHTCMFNFWIPFHPIQKHSGSICCIKKSKNLSLLQSMSTIKQMPHGFLFKFPPNWPWVFGVYNCCCVNNFQSKVKRVKKNHKSYQYSW